MEGWMSIFRCVVNTKWCHSLQDLIDFLSYVAVYAPDAFPDEDGVTLDLDSAFHELHHGASVASQEILTAGLSDFVGEGIDLAYAHFVDGKVKEGSDALLDVQHRLQRLV